MTTDTPTPPNEEAAPPPTAPDDPIGHALALVRRAEAAGPWEGGGDEGGWLLMLADAWSNLLTAAALQRIAATLECLDRQAHDGFFRVVLTDPPTP